MCTDKALGVLASLPLCRTLTKCTSGAQTILSNQCSGDFTAVFPLLLKEGYVSYINSLNGRKLMYR